MSANPRWLGTIPDEEDTGALTTALERLRRAESMVQLTLYPEWTEIDAFARDEELDATKGLAYRADDMASVESYRAKLRVSLWLQELPELARVERDNLLAEVERLQAPQGG